MKKIRIACIGSGWVTENRHIPSLLRNGKYTITSIISKDKAQLQALYKRYHIPVYCSYSFDLFDARWFHNCDAVIIGTDPQCHFYLANYCLDNNKHILVEKPFVMTADEAEKIIQKANKKNVCCSVVHNFQFSRGFSEMKKAIEKNKLGELDSILAFQLSNKKRRLPSWYDSLPWGLFFDESPHFFYLLKQYGGDMVMKNSAHVIDRNGGNTPSMISADFFSSSKKMNAHIYMNFNSPISEWFFAVLGRKSIAIVDLFRDTYIVLPNDGSHMPFDIMNTMRHVWGQGIYQVYMSGINFLQQNHLVGMDHVVDLFGKAILSGNYDNSIHCSRGLEVLSMQEQLMKHSVVI